jgi:type I restriction enzyme S subunit
MFRWDDVKRWSTEKAQTLSDYFLSQGDVVLAMDRPWIEAGLKYACVSEHDKPCLLVQRVSRLRAKTTLDQKFLRYVIGSPEFTNYILGTQTGTAVPHISSNQIKGYKFLLPTLSEQRAIAGILGALDDKIEVNRRMNATLEFMARAVFCQWFTENPDLTNWELSRIGDLGNLDKGVSYKGAFLTEEGMPMINLGCFQGKGKFNIENLKTYSGEYKERHTVKPGDIVLANTDITQKREVIGSPAIVPDYPAKEYLFTHHTYALRVTDNSPVLKNYLYFTLLQEEFRERAEGFATGTTVLALPRDAVLDYEISMPPADLLQKFYEQVHPMLEKVQSNIKESRTLGSLRDSLLPKLMRGDVRVKDVED